MRSATMVDQRAAKPVCICFITPCNGVRSGLGLGLGLGLYVGLGLGLGLGLADDMPDEHTLLDKESTPQAFHGLGGRRFWEITKVERL